MAACADNGPGSSRGLENVSDLELMLLIRDGNASALEALLDRYWRPLVRYAARLVISVDSAEDMVQEAFVRIWQERAAWKPVGTPQAFLYRIVRNQALQELRKGEVRARKASDLSARRQPIANPLDIAAGEELNLALQNAIDSLPPRRREAFVLVRYHELALGEVAEIMEISTQTVSNHVSLVVADLRRSLWRFLP